MRALWAPRWGRAPASAPEPLRLRSRGARFPLPMAVLHLGLWLLLASCCFSSCDAQLLDWIWGSPKTTGTPTAPSTAEISPTLSTPLSSAAAGDVATTQRHREPSTAAPTGQESTESTDGPEQGDGSTAGISVPTSTARTAAPPRSTPPTRSPTETPQPLGTGNPNTTDLPQQQEGTGGSPQRPAAARPGRAPFPFPSGDSAHHPTAQRHGASPTPHAADHAETWGWRPWAIPRPSPATPGAATPGDGGPKRSTDGEGSALLGVSGNQSPSAPKLRAMSGADSPPAGPPEFDLLTSTLRVVGAGLAPSFPRLLPAGGRCLPLPAHLPFCSVLGTNHVRLPNYLSHGSEVEIRAALHEWEGLLESRCHRYLEWFLCLLLVPGCSASVPVTPPPCQGFCEAVRDLCWMHSAGGRLPLPCDSLPKEDGGYSCVFVNVSAGNVAGDPCSCLPSACLISQSLLVLQGMLLPRLWPKASLPCLSFWVWAPSAKRSLLVHPQIVPTGVGCRAHHGDFKVTPGSSWREPQGIASPHGARAVTSHMHTHMSAALPWG